MTSEPADSLRAEMEFLLQCLRDTSSGEPNDDALIALAPDVPWDAFVEETTRHGVAPLVYKRLEPIQEAVGMPDTALEQLRDIYIHNALRNAAHLEEVKRILIAFRDADVPVIVLKGVDLAVSVYAEPALRPMQDLDLLIHDRDALKTTDVMRHLRYHQEFYPELGIDYDTFHHLAPFHKKGALPVEVHRNLSDPNDPFKIDIEGIWSRARPIEVDDVEAKGMCPEDILAYLCAHAAYNHEFDVSLLSLHDISRSIHSFATGPLAWGLLSVTANGDQRSRFVFSVLELVRQLLRAPIPRSALARLKHSVADQEIVATLAASISSPDVDVPVGYRELARAGSWKEFSVFVRGTFPSRLRLAKTYGVRPGSPLVYLLYIIRPLDVLRRRGTILFGLLVGSARGAPVAAAARRQRSITLWAKSALVSEASSQDNNNPPRES